MSPGYGSGLYGTELYGIEIAGPDRTLPVRELPPLRMHLEAITPSGRRYRWGEDEPDPANVPSGLRHSSTMPGGHESCECVLPRKPGVDYSDLERFSTLRVWGAGGDLAWEGRLERAPRVSGDAVAVSPSAVGYQAALEDDKSASMIYIDRALSRWQDPTAPRRLALIGLGYGPSGPTVQTNPYGAPELATTFNGSWTTLPRSEAWYDAGSGNLIGQIRATWTKAATVNHGDVNWAWSAFLSSDDVATVYDEEPEAGQAGPAFTALSASGERRFAAVALWYGGGAGGIDNTPYSVGWTDVVVIGNHGLPLVHAPSPGGFYASDVVAHAVATWAPELAFVAGETILPSTYVIPHLAFPEPTTAGEIVKKATGFGFQDWAVWDGPTFWWHDRGAVGRNWRARIGPAQLEETGPQVDRLWNSILVQYQDVDGSTRTVGPVGSGADTEDDALRDTDPDNPANLAGITRRDVLVMGISTAGQATTTGYRFLQETKALDRSGRARLVGHVTDDRGVLHPYWRVRAGDTITFMDAADSSPRRIVRADHDRTPRTCTVDLDAPPESMTALLERLGANLVSLGL